MSFFKKLYPNNKNSAPMGCVYAGPDYFKKKNAEMSGVYAGPEYQGGLGEVLPGNTKKTEEEISYKKKFCENCGMKITDEEICPVCGEEINQKNK